MATSESFKLAPTTLMSSLLTPPTPPKKINAGFDVSSKPISGRSRMPSHGDTSEDSTAATPMTATIKDMEKNHLLQTFVPRPMNKLLHVGLGAVGMAGFAHMTVWDHYRREEPESPLASPAALILAAAAFISWVSAWHVLHRVHPHRGKFLLGVCTVFCAVAGMAGMRKEDLLLAVLPGSIVVVMSMTWGLPKDDGDEAGRVAESDTKVAARGGSHD